MPRLPLTQSQRWLLAGIAAIAGLLVVIVGLVQRLDDEDAGPTTTTTTTSTTTTTTSTTTTTLFESPVDPFAVAYPSPDGSQRFEDPSAVARAYATEVLGFTDLYLDPFDPFTDDWGEVVVRSSPASADDPATVADQTRIEVRVEADGTWYALGSETEDIVVTAPIPGASLATPFETSGRALAFEGTVDVLVRSQAEMRQRGAGFVTGSGVPPAGPFDGRIFFSPPLTPEPGILVFRTLSAEDGRVEKASSFPVRLTSASPETVADDCGDTADTGGDPDGDLRVVKVYFHCGLDSTDDVVALRRAIPADEPAVLTRTLEMLVAGPTASERAAGFTSPFPVEGGTVVRVVIDGGVATVDLGRDFLHLANSSHNILTLRAEIFRTATQFSSVAAVEVLYGGSCEDFANWSQSDSCLLTG